MTTPTGNPTPERAKTPAQFTRRGFGILGSAVLVGGMVFGARWFNISAQAGADGTLSTPDAHEAALSGQVLLVDIRRPDEWSHTGVGEGAVPLDMRRPDFIDMLLVLTKGQSDRPVALICARGVRSRALGNRLRDAGFTKIIDVPEGMLGSGAGPGWVRRGLPTVAWQDS